MTPQEFADQLRQKAQEIRANNRPLQLGAASAHARISKRIFTDGLDTKGSRIGTYSTKDIWINPDKTATRNKKGFNPRAGKTGKSVFASTGQPHKSSYFKGWKGFREVQGLRTDYVNLNNVGDLKSDFDRPLQREDINTYKADLSREINNKKARGAEAHFDTEIFSPSKEEIKAFNEVVEKELKLFLSR